MPCAEYNRLEEEGQAKVRAEASIYMSGYSPSIEAGIEKRRIATSERVSAEKKLVNHVKDCSVCQAEGKKAWHVDDRPITP